MTRYNLKTIIPGVGINELKFGLQKSDVKSLLGTPDEFEKYSYTNDENNLTEVWYYDDLGLDVSFDDDDDWKLGLISIESNAYNLFDFIPIGLSIDKIKEQLKKHGVNDLIYEDWSNVESPLHELLSSEKLGINFWFDEEKCNEIQCSPLYIDENTIDWP